MSLVPMYGRRPRRTPINYKPAPDGVVLYAIGDIHGRLDLLQTQLSLIDQTERYGSSGVSVEVYLGDYVDRGNRSAEVLDLLIQRARHRRCVFLRGNHEAMLIKILSGTAEPEVVSTWMRLGGSATALSYGVGHLDWRTDDGLNSLVSRLRVAVPERHLAFLKQTVDYFDAGPYVFVHAGIRPGRALGDQSCDDLFWIRSDFLDAETNYGFVVVHGHTAVFEPEFRQNRINIDTGAYATGRLTCLRIDQHGPVTLQMTPQAVA